jgi:hypothetical protein
MLFCNLERFLQCVLEDQEWEEIVEGLESDLGAEKKEKAALSKYCNI